MDLFTGLHGWASGLIAAGWEVIGFDLEDMSKLVGEPMPDHFHLVIQDVLTLHGRQFKDAQLIVSSSPCTKYSYMAMPWSRAQAQAAEIRADETGEELRKLNLLFDAQFRIQREACEAAGRYIPMVVENVKGAQPWVGRARWSYGSYFLWGDLPALMTTASVEGMKGGGGTWFHDYVPGQGLQRNTSSKSPARKMASAKIAKIPLTLATWIGQVYYPRADEKIAASVSAGG